jgi:hypothetical protein
MFFLLLLDQEHYVFELWVVELVQQVRLWSIKLARNNDQWKDLFSGGKRIFTGIFFGCGGGASRIIMGPFSTGGGG